MPDKHTRKQIENEFNINSPIPAYRTSGNGLKTNRRLWQARLLPPIVASVAQRSDSGRSEEIFYGNINYSCAPYWGLCLRCAAFRCYRNECLFFPFHQDVPCLLWLEHMLSVKHIILSCAPFALPPIGHRGRVFAFQIKRK